MSRTLSAAAIAALYGQESDEVAIALLTITHASLGTVIRLSSDATERISDEPLIYRTVSRGNDYLYAPFQFVLPEDKADSPPRCTIALDNIDRSMTDLLRSVSTPPVIAFELVMSGSPDVVEMVLPAMLLTDVEIAAETINITLQIDGLETEPFPAFDFNPVTFPGLF
jgi:hypothetical protein